MEYKNNHPSGTLWTHLGPENNNKITPNQAPLRASRLDGRPPQEDVACL